MKRWLVWRRGAFKPPFWVILPPQLKMVSDAGEVMPPKATYFYPKLPAGLVVNWLGSF